MGGRAAITELEFVITQDHDAEQKQHNLTQACEVSGEESIEKMKARIQETIAIVCRRMDSDDWVPWSPPSDEEMTEIRIMMKADPTYVRPEIAASEWRHKERLSAELTKTTAHSKISNGFNRESLGPRRPLLL